MFELFKNRRKPAQQGGSKSVIRAPIDRILPSFVPVIFERGIPGYETEMLIPGEVRIPPESLRSVLVASAFVGASSHAVERGFELDKVEAILAQSIKTLPELSPSEANKALDLIDRFNSFHIIRAEHSLDDWLCEALWPEFQSVQYEYPSAMSAVMSYAIGIADTLRKMALEY